jgi:hypothetical protein
MREMKNKQPKGSNRWLLVVTFILALLPFSSQLASISGQKVSVNTELVAVKKIPSKRTVSFESTSRRSHHEAPLESLSVIARLSILHSTATKRIKEHRHYLDSIHRLRCGQTKIIPISDEEPSLLS